MKNLTLHCSVLLLLLCAAPLISAQQTTEQITSGKILRVDRNDNTITVETMDGLVVYDVDNDDLEITEVGVFENTEDASMRELRLGDIVRITETIETAVPERRRVRRVERERPVAPAPVAVAVLPATLPKTASAQPLMIAVGVVLLLAAGVLRTARSLQVRR